MTEKETRLERVRRRFDKQTRDDSTFWRFPLTEAVMTLLRSGEPVTIDSLIERLKKPLEVPDVPLTAGASMAAIDRLQKLRTEMEGDHQK
ncbi:hypothetical protein CCR97_04305 [Rhodoplanes elegans]|uniref:Uncharacterized protein n=1 Tax=Rhodoplanes elegans TaxID=29408 RepID=A0A327JWY0_9BRAD|nr:hypothetical protein [Rhodoplanes elegans]RAI31020.1 hypothetical protein CH338_26580 [Rhodoplanes elegans]